MFTNAPLRLALLIEWSSENFVGDYTRLKIIEHRAKPFQPARPYCLVLALEALRGAEVTRHRVTALRGDSPLPVFVTTAFQSFRFHTIPPIPAFQTIDGSKGGGVRPPLPAHLFLL